MSRLDELRIMRDFLDREIAAELKMLGAPLGSDSLIRRAADLYGVAVADVLCGNRAPQVTKARQGAAWLLRGQGMSLPEVGRVLGVHHTTVLHACRKIDGATSVKAMLRGLEVAS